VPAEREGGRTDMNRMRRGDSFTAGVFEGPIL